MKILMTGGTGLIGRRFIKRFTEHQFTVLTRHPEQAAKCLPAAVSSIASLSELNNLDDFDAVINLAGEPIIGGRWTDQQKAIICQSRWQITGQLVTLFERSAAPPAVFLSGSAIGVYGDQGEAVITEDSEVGSSSFTVQLCQQWESIAHRAEKKTRVVCLRTGIVLDPDGGALAKMLLPFKCFLGGQVGNGKHYMSWIHYQDMIDAMALLLVDKDARGAFNMVAPAPVTNQTFTAMLAAALSRFAILPVPKKALQIVLGEASCLLLDSQKVKPKKLLSRQFKFSFPHLDLALAQLLKSSANTEGVD